MWQISVVIYTVTGLCIVLFTRARGVIRKSLSNYGAINTNPMKETAFLIIMHFVSFLLWPLFLFSWFSTQKPKTLWDALNEEPIFHEQKEIYDAINLLCDDGVDADELPNSEGEFGMTPSSPIPCKTVYGSASYLARLRTNDGIKVVYERSGSLESTVSPMPIDEYEISHPNGQKLATIFISPYQKRISNKAPKGFQLTGL